MDLKKIFTNRLDVVSIIIIVILITPFFFLEIDDSPKEVKVEKKESTTKSNKTTETQESQVDDQQTHFLDQLIENPTTYHNQRVTLKGVARLITINHRSQFYGFRFYADGKKIFVGSYKPSILPNNDDKIFLNGKFIYSRLSPVVWGNYPYVIEAIAIEKIN